MFEPIQITLSYEGDQASRKIREGLVWNMFLKVTKKIEILLTLLRDRALKNYLDQCIGITNKKNVMAVSPFTTTEYSWTYWRSQGIINVNKLLQGEGISSKLKWKVFDIKMATILLKKIYESYTQSIYSPPSSDEIVFLFDSEHFFNGGHLAGLEETLDIFAACIKKVRCYFLLDRRMILFPTLANLITSKYKFCEVVDITKNTLCLDKLKGIKCDELENSEAYAEGEYNIISNRYINPCLCWSNKRSQANLTTPETAWGSHYEKALSRQVVSIELEKKGFKLAHKNYIAVHSRNATFLSDNVRSSLPLRERGELLDAISGLNVLVIVLGVNKLEDKYHSEDIVYLDELGTFDDSFQIHVLNGAIALVGSASGISHMTYCTNTPTLLFDVPFPYCACMPRSTWLILLKRLKKHSERVDMSEYYKFSVSAYDRVQTDGTMSAKSPLALMGIELVCNTDATIYTALTELLYKHYDKKWLQKENIKLEASMQAEIKMDERAEHDRSQIDNQAREFKKSRHFQTCGLDSLARANWLHS